MLWRNESKTFRIPVFIEFDAVRLIKITESTTVKELVKMLAPKSSIEKGSLASNSTSNSNYEIVQVIRDKKELPIREFKSLDGQVRLLDVFPEALPDEDVEDQYMPDAARDEFKAKSIALECRLWLIETSSKISIFFNTYLRMLIGIPYWHLEIWFAPGMNISRLTNMIKWALGIDNEDERFGLYANYQTHLDKLEGGMSVLELRKWDDPSNPFLFQFQMYPEFEDQTLLGIARKSNLLLKNGIMDSEYWCALKGTTLFLFDDSKRKNVKKTISRIDLCKIIYRGPNVSKSMYEFEIKHPEHGLFKFKSSQKKRAERWVRALRESRQSTEIQQIVTMKHVRQLTLSTEMLKPINSMPIGDPDAANAQLEEEMLIKDITSDKRKCIENMEALLHKIELDASVLQMNGVERPLGRKWLEDVRELLVAATQCSENDLDYLDDCIPRLELINDRIANWKKHIQGPQRMPSPTVSIKDIVSDCADICHSYNYYVLGLKKDEAKKCYSSEDSNRIKSIFRSLKNLFNSKSMTFTGNARKSIESRLKNLSLRSKPSNNMKGRGKEREGQIVHDQESSQEDNSTPIMSRMKEMFTLKTPSAIEARKIREREKKIKEREDKNDDYEHGNYNPLESPLVGEDGEGEYDQIMSESESNHQAMSIDPRLSLRRAKSQPKSASKAKPMAKSNRAVMLTTRPPVPKRYSSSRSKGNESSIGDGDENFFSRFYREPIKALNNYLPAFATRDGRSNHNGNIDHDYHDEDGDDESGSKPTLQKNAYHICTGCERAIIRGGIMTSNQDYYHEKCFKCVFCAMSLTPNSYREERGALMCRGQCRYAPNSKQFKVR